MNQAASYDFAVLTHATLDLESVGPLCDRLDAEFGFVQ